MAFPSCVDNPSKTYDKLIGMVEKHLSQKQAEIERQKQQEEIKRKADEKLVANIALAKKYDVKSLNPIATYHEILDAILKQNKYLYLAHYMAANRGDWSDGYSLAEQGLNYFITQKVSDKAVDSAIIEDVGNCISSWDGDGRCFRDTKWSYDAIFALVDDEDLYKDYNSLVNS